MHHLTRAGSAQISNSCNVVYGPAPQRLGRIAIKARIESLVKSGKVARDLSGRRNRIQSPFLLRIQCIYRMV